MPKPFHPPVADVESPRPDQGRAPALKTESVVRRRTFSPAEKLRIVRLADACTERGELEALLRREGIYSSSLAQWRRALREAGEQGLGSRRVGRRAKKDAKDRRIEQLERRTARLERELDISRKLIELQKKASELLGITLPAPGDEP